MVEKAKKIWLDGKFVDWDDANVHILTHTLHYGLGIFEGIRCYECEDGRSAVFRLPEHVGRFFDSAHSMLMEIPYSREEVIQAILDTLRTNEQKAGYIRPLAFIGDGAMGLHPQDNPIRVSIITWPWGAYLGEEGLTKGIRAKVSSFTRHHVNIMMTKTKTCGNYANSILAKLEVTRDGYDEAIMLDTEGYVCEASGENIFIVRRGELRTPPLTSILAGITRDSVIKIARDLGFMVREERFSRDELYIADEAFFTGTAAEITPIREVDRRTIGEGRPGPLTKKLQDTFFQVVKGTQPKYKHWLTYL
ncbi:MAG: branched-chain amino acid transaminase [Deltaproteobacteria bacterium]|nr:MAG: branched-chain amino acid transaminase [Deltaproteobacteria bacterium]